MEIAPVHSHPGVLHFRVGEALTAAGRYDAAIAQLMGARRMDGARPAIELTLGQALLMDGRSGEAVSHLAAALDGGFRPEVSGPWLVRALAAAGRTEAAARALAALPDEVVEAAQVDTQLDLGTLALRIDAPATAERWLRAAVAHAPDRAEAQAQLAVALVMLGRPAEALGPWKPRAAWTHPAPRPTSTWPSSTRNSAASRGARAGGESPRGSIPPSRAQPRS